MFLDSISPQVTRGRAQLHLEAQQLALTALVRRLDADLSSELGTSALEHWHGPAHTAFVIAAAALRREVTHLIDVVRTADRLTEAALAELAHSV